MSETGIVAIYAGVNAVLILALAYNVGRHRQRTGAFAPGSTGDETLTCAIRAHGNATEYIPFAILMMFILSFLSTPQSILYTYGSIFTLGRLAQAYGMTRKKHPNAFRFMGNLSTGLVYLFGALACFYYSVKS